MHPQRGRAGCDRTLRSKKLHTFHARYQVIPWSASGRHRLTIRLGLFLIGLLSGYGPTGLQQWPELDPITFAPYLDNGGKSETEDTTIVRDESARKTHKDASKASGKACEKDPGTSHGTDGRETSSVTRGKRRPMPDTITDSVGNTHWTRSGVQAMEFDDNAVMYVYTNPEGKRCHIERGMAVYDSETAQWGRFQWISIMDSSRNEQRRKVGGESSSSGSKASSSK